MRRRSDVFSVQSGPSPPRPDRSRPSRASSSIACSQLCGAGHYRMRGGGAEAPPCEGVAISSSGCDVFEPSCSSACSRPELRRPGGAAGAGLRRRHPRRHGLRRHRRRRTRAPTSASAATASPRSATSSAPSAATVDRRQRPGGRARLHQHAVVVDRVAARRRPLAGRDPPGRDARRSSAKAARWGRSTTR